jgi:hypothetical protein
MGYESGALTFHAFYLAKPFVSADIERFATRLLPPLNTLASEPIHGWAGPTHALDKDLTEGHCWRGDYLWFSHVKAQKKPPASLVRATLMAELEVERRARDVEVLPRAAKTEVKERVMEALTREAQPSFTSMECAIDLRNQRLLAGAMSDAAIQVLAPFFRETTGCIPVMCGPESAAYRLRGVDCNNLDLVPMTHNPEAAGASEVCMGDEFLTWLFYRWETEGCDFMMNGEKCSLMFEGPLTFAGDKTLGCHETLLRNGTPLNTPELGIALWNGKFLRRAKLTLTKNDWVVSATVDGRDFAFRSMRVDPVKQSEDADAVSEMPSAPKGEGGSQKLTVDERLDRASFYVDAFLFLYGEFLDLRADAVGWRSLLASVHKWIDARMKA